MSFTKNRLWRLLAIVAAFSIVAAACGGDGEPVATPTGTGTASPTGEPTGVEFVYRIATFADTTTDNFWAYYDPESSVWNAYFLGATKAGLYEILFPGLETNPDAAADPLPELTQEGDAWTATVPIRDDAVWSDGTPITADDAVFTFETVRDLKLGGNWLTAYPLPDPDNPDKVGIASYEKVDDKTVKISFNQRPGLAIWPFSTAVAPIMPAHFWQSVVEEARGSDDPAAALYGAPGEGEPSSGPFIVSQREAGAFVQLSPNENYFRRDEQVTSGTITFRIGPFANQEIQSLYESQDAAVLALKNGEVDFLLNPLGMQRGLQSQVLGDPNLKSIVNGVNGFRYLAFNMRKPPMSIPAFRQALNIMIDKEFMAERVLQGVAFPLWNVLPQANAAFWDQALADEIANKYKGLTEEDRLNQAVQVLKDAGFTWAREPAWNAELGSVEPGQGIRLPNGQPVQEIELIAPGPAYDPLRATYSVWIEQFGNNLGIPIRANPTDFNTIVDKVFSQVDFDIFILGWSLTVFPDHYESFFHSRNWTEKNGGNNAMGYENRELDRLADQLLRATTIEEAKDLVWQMETILDQDLPYIVLFDTGILEFYRTTVQYPFTDSLSGLQYLHQSTLGHAIATASAR